MAWRPLTLKADNGSDGEDEAYEVQRQWLLDPTHDTPVEDRIDRAVEYGALDLLDQILELRSPQSVPEAVHDIIALAEAYTGKRGPGGRFAPGGAGVHTGAKKTGWDKLAPGGGAPFIGIVRDRDGHGVGAREGKLLGEPDGALETDVAYQVNKKYPTRAKALKACEAELRTIRGHERMYLIRDDGMVTWAVEGKMNECNTHGIPDTDLKGATVTHNHPIVVIRSSNDISVTSGALSPQDVGACLLSGARQIRAINEFDGVVTALAYKGPLPSRAAITSFCGQMDHVGECYRAMAHQVAGLKLSSPDATWLKVVGDADRKGLRETLDMALDSQIHAPQEVVDLVKGMKYTETGP